MFTIKLTIFIPYKDFLRAVPGTIFSADLYDQWLGVLEENEDMVAAIQRW